VEGSGLSDRERVECLYGTKKEKEVLYQTGNECKLRRRKRSERRREWSERKRKW